MSSRSVKRDHASGVCFDCHVVMKVDAIHHVDREHKRCNNVEFSEKAGIGPMVRVRKDDQIKSQCTHVNEYHRNGDEQRPCLVDSPVYQFRHERSCVCAKTA